MRPRGARVISRVFAISYGGHCSRLRAEENAARVSTSAGSPGAGAIPLSDKEVEARRRELQQLTRTSLAWRVFTYFMGCSACQTFWTAVAIYALTRGVADPAAWFFCAPAYSGAVVLLAASYTARQQRGHDAPGRTHGCKSCRH